MKSWRKYKARREHRHRRGKSNFTESFFPSQRAQRANKVQAWACVIFPQLHTREQSAHRSSSIVRSEEKLEGKKSNGRQFPSCGAAAAVRWTIIVPSYKGDKEVDSYRCERPPQVIQDI